MEAVERSKRRSSGVGDKVEIQDARTLRRDEVSLDWKLRKKTQTHQRGPVGESWRYCTRSRKRSAEN